MQTNTSVISNSKIIILIVFICCALMASLFVYHMRNKQELTVFADGNATLFPIARDIKPFKLASTNGPSFSQQDLIGHYTLAFFGFTHCNSVCPATLNLLAHQYDQLKAAAPNLQIVFISLDPERDNIEKLTAYVHSFNHEFIGVAGKIQDIRKLQSQLGIYSARDESSPDANYQLMHTPSIILIDPKGKWAGLYKADISPRQLVDAFKASIQSHE